MGNVVQGDGLVEEHFVEGQRETAIQMVSVKDSKAHYPSDKVEVGQVLTRKEKEKKEKKKKVIHESFWVKQKQSITGLTLLSGLTCRV